MIKLIEIDGRWIHVSSKIIEINGAPVVTQGDIKIINPFNTENELMQAHLAHEQRQEGELYAA